MSNSMSNLRSKKSNFIDHGYAWVVLVASTLIVTLMEGTQKSYGLFFLQYLQLFQGSVSSTALITGVLTAVQVLTTLFIMMWLIGKVQIRILVAVGVLLNAIGYFLSSFAPNLEFLILSQSVFIGAGIGFYNGPSLVLLNKYFHKRQGLANAVFMSGYAFGGVVLPPIFNTILEQCGIRDGLIFTSCFVLQAMIACMLLRPVQFFSSHNIESEEVLYSHVTSVETKEIETTSFVERHKFEETKNISESNIDCCENSGDTLDENHQKLLSNCDSKISLHSHESSFASITHQQSNHLVNAFSSMSSIGQSDMHVQKANDPYVDHREGQGQEMIGTCPTFKRFHQGLLCEKAYIIFIAMYSFCNVAVNTAPVYLATLVAEQGLSSTQVALCMSVCNISDFVGRLIAGVMCDFTSATPKHVIFISQILIVISTQLTRFYTTLTLAIIYSVLFGMATGMLPAVYAKYLRSLIGDDRFPRGVFIFIVIMELFNAINFPIPGYLKDISGTYVLSFHYVGVCSLVGVIFLAFLSACESLP